MKRARPQKITVNPALAVTGWLVLLVFPCFFLNIAFNLFVKSSLQRRIEMVKPQLTNEMNRFMEEATPEYLLRSKLKQFDQKFGFDQIFSEEKSSQLEKMKSLNARELRQKLCRHLGFEVACVFYYGPDTIDVSMDYSPELRASQKELPRIFLTRLLAFLGRQDQKDILIEDSSRNSLSRLLNKDGEDRLADNVAFLLQTLFKTITPVVIKEKFLYRTIAANIGKTGPIFYYFSPCRLEDGKKVYNLGGYLAVIRAQDISAGKILSVAMKNSPYSNFHRRLRRAKRGVVFPDHYQTDSFFAIEKDQKKIFIRAFAPEEFLHQLISSGTILVENTKKWAASALVFEVVADLDHFQHRMWFYRNEVKLFLLIIFCFGTAVFLRLSLFGINFNISVAAKVTLAIFFASLLPSSLLILTYAAFEDYHSESSRQTIKQYLELRQSVLQKQFLSKILSYQSFIIEVAEKLEKLGIDEGKEESISHWLEKSQAVSAYFETIDKGSKYLDLSLPGAPKHLNKVEFDLIVAMANSYMQFLYQSPILGKSTSEIILALTKGLSNSATLHDFIRHSGVFVDISRISKNMKFCSLPLYDFHHGKMPLPATLLILAFSQKSVVEKAFSDLKREMTIAEQWDEYKVEQAVFFRDASEVKLLQHVSSSGIKANEIIPVVSLCQKLKRRVVWESQEKERFRLIVTQYDQKWPYISVFIASKIAVNNVLSDSRFWVAAIFYVLVLILLIWKLTRLTFIDPISNISGGLAEIARGNLQHQFNIQTGDEFENLSDQFNKMTRRLCEREKLAMYVSRDVLEVVSSEREQILKPGGELIEAAILFCEPDRFAEINRSLAPSKIVEQLNYFLAACARICAQNQGTIDKLVDDTLMMVFRNKSGAEIPIFRASKTALALREIFFPGNRSFPYSLNIGGSCGKVVSGKIGSKTGKLDFTLIGDAVNMAARIKGLAKEATHTRIVLTAESAKKIEDQAFLQSLGKFKIKGKSGQHEIFELLRV